MSKFAIYTACIGGYDNISQPEVIDNRFDYILFVNDNRGGHLGVWQVRKINYKNPNEIRIARYAKTHPEELLPEYDATLWLDANIQILNQCVYERVFELYRNNVEIAGVTHPHRDCIYDEAFELMRLKWEHDIVLFRWCSMIRRDNFPQHYGMYETNILFRRNSQIMHEFDNLWWRCIDQNSYRDQMSCSYVLWKLEIGWSFFLQQGKSVWNTNAFRYIWHPEKAFMKKKKQLGLQERIRWDIRHNVFGDNNLYKRIYMRLYSYPFSPIALFAREAIDLIWYFPYKLLQNLLHIARK